MRRALVGELHLKQLFVLGLRVWQQFHLTRLALTQREERGAEATAKDIDEVISCKIQKTRLILAAL